MRKPSSLATHKAHKVFIRGLAAFAIAGFLSSCAGTIKTAAPTTEPDEITIHYHRYDGDYTGLGIWTWDNEIGRAPEQPELFPVGEDDYGQVLKLDPALYGPEDKPASIGFVPRLRGDWNQKDGADRFWRPDMGDEIWMIGNDQTIYTTKPDTSPKVQFAFLDQFDKITVTLSHPMTLAEATPDKFQVKYAKGGKLGVSAVKPVGGMEDSSKVFELTTEESVDYKKDLMVDAKGYTKAKATLRNILLDREHFYYEGQLGPIYTKENTTFRVFAPTAEAVNVVLYNEREGDKGRKVVAMKPIEQGVWEAVVKGDLDEKFYMLTVQAPGTDPNHEIVDINSICNTGHDGRGLIVDTRRLDPEGFRPVQRPANIERPVDAVIWEVNLRDFTMDESSGVPAELRGKYLGAALRGTRVPGTDWKTGIDYLVDLGVTHVQILPIQDFDNRETEETYNWGYMTSSFDSPDGWFATDHTTDSRIREFKQLIQAFHTAGIRVVMDVVYNHTAPNSTFEQIVPGYYHRRRDDGSFWNGSGTGNEFRSEAPMASKYIVDSCKYWAEEYGVDGFRFDLMGLIDADTMQKVAEEVKSVDPTLLVYGEPWAAGANGLKRVTDKPTSSRHGLGAFNDEFRNAVKGAPDGNEPGFVHDGRNSGAIQTGLFGAVHSWAITPNHVIQYLTCHDNLTLWDKTMVAAPNVIKDEHVKMNGLAIGLVAVSQGIMFLHAGSEIAYNKDGEHNSYNKPDSVNSIKWNQFGEFENLHAFTKGMIALRRSHPLFRMDTREELEKRIRFTQDSSKDPKFIAERIDGQGIDGEEWKTALVLINGNPGKVSFDLPEGNWDVYVEDMKAGTEVMRTASGTIEISGRTMTVLAQK